jgi:hypothetical protein
LRWNQRPRASLSLAGFEVTLIGRFWVTPEANGIENFWSLLKRGIGGTYVAVEPFHLDRYVDEQVFRYNNRATADNPMNDFDRFSLAVTNIVGKRLTYAELTGKEGETAF